MPALPIRPLALAAVALLLSAPAAGAQSVPSWASPSGGPSAPSGGTTMAAPPTTPSGGVSQVPVDGGLGLLAVAGGLYAVRRLRQD